MSARPEAQPDAVTLARALRALSFAIARCRFSLLMLAGGFALLMSDQGRDLLIAYGEDGKTARLTLAAFLWALSIWGWARTLLDIAYEDPPACLRCYNQVRRWLPRLLGGFAFVALGLSAARADQAPLAWWAAGGFVAFLIIVWKRRWVSNHLARWARESQSEGARWVARFLEAPEIGASSPPPYRDLWAALQLPEDRSRWDEEVGPRALIAMGLTLAWALFFLLATVSPVWLGVSSGAMILFFIWGATWLPVGSVLSYLADKHGIPLLTSLSALALVSSLYNDNHEIRHLERAAQDVQARPSVTEGLAAWEKANPSPGADPVPFVVVATAGGGIRAAYWTGTVLGALHDDSARFPDRLFAVSGVSGGSVGAAVYRALLSLDAEQRQASCPAGMAACIHEALGEDFLGPVAAALLFPDLTQRFVPFPVFPDRAAALERGWEAKLEALTGVDVLGRSLSSLSRQDHRPALFLNATWVDNGRRLVASNLRYAPEPSAEARAFARSNDQLAVLGRDLRLSTAAHNSARFPVVSPPGSWQGVRGTAGRLQDGGLFENFGAETALEILDLACQTFNCVPAPGTLGGGATAGRATRAVFPVVVLISSDPTLPSDLAASPVNRPIELAYELRSTLRAYERTRSGRGVEAASRLQEWAAQRQARFFHFRMCDPKAPGAQPPLGWALSTASAERIRSYLLGGDASPAPSCRPDNAGAREALRGLLSGAGV
jgi:hypothetical protein